MNPTTTTCPAVAQHLNGVNTSTAIMATIVLVAALAFVAFLVGMLIR